MSAIRSHSIDSACLSSGELTPRGPTIRSGLLDSFNQTRVTAKNMPVTVERKSIASADP